MSTIGNNLGAWLRKTPQPRIVVVDGSKRIEVGNHGGKWRDLVRTIESLNARQLECLDSSGNILRAGSLDDDEPDEKPKAPQAGPACPHCGVSIDKFAQLLADGYERGSKTQHPILDQALNFIDRQAQQLDRQQREIERLRALANKLQGELLEVEAQAQAGGTEDPLSHMAAGFLQAQAAETMNGAAAAAPTNGKSNGS